MSETRNLSPEMGAELSAVEKQELVDLRRRNRISLDNEPLSDAEKERLHALEIRPGGEKPKSLLSLLDEKE